MLARWTWKSATINFHFQLHFKSTLLRTLPSPSTSTYNASLNADFDCSCESTSELESWCDGISLLRKFCAKCKFSREQSRDEMFFLKWLFVLSPGQHSSRNDCYADKLSDYLACDLIFEWTDHSFMSVFDLKQAYLALISSIVSTSNFITKAFGN